jgi:peptidoglycan/LPS O-acetylase OafA/YrhL
MLDTRAPKQVTAVAAAAPRHIPALDGLRGLAVLAVVIFHTGHLTGGYLGVDLFFVLSGYLITTLLLAERSSTGQTSLTRFWSRRARRLLPALLVVLLAVVVYARFFAEPFELESLRRQTLASLFYVANWSSISAGADYWARSAGPSPLQHTWSLAIEEQFYLVWPLIVVATFASVRKLAGNATDQVHRLGTRRLMRIAIALAIASLVLMVGGSLNGADPNRLYFGSDTRFGSILVGVVLACALHLYGPVRSATARRNLEIVAALGAVGLAVAWFTVDGQSAFVYDGGLTLCALAGVAIIASAAHPTKGPIGTALSWRPLCWLGLISYGLYLWHWPVLQIVDADRTSLDGAPLLVLQLSLSLALAVASYFLIELPIRRRRLITTRQAFVVVPTAVVLLVVLTLVWMQPRPVDVDAVLEPIRVTNAPVNDTGAPRPPRVLIVGDSVGESLANGLVGHEDRLGVDVQSLARSACGVQREVTRIRLLDGTIGPDGDGCAAVIDSWAPEIQRFKPDDVILVLGFAGGLDKEVDGVWRQPCDAEFQTWYRAQLEDALTALTAGGQPVVLTTAPYAKPGAHPSAARDHDDDCLNDLYRQLATTRPGVRLVDLAAHVCPGNVCEASVDGFELRPDGLHYYGESSAIVGSWLLQQVLGPPSG